MLLSKCLLTQRMDGCMGGLMNEWINGLKSWSQCEVSTVIDHYAKWHCRKGCVALTYPG